MRADVAHNGDGNTPAQSAAFFDLDRTLMEGSSAFQFGRAAYRAGLLSRALLPLSHGCHAPLQADPPGPLRAYKYPRAVEFVTGLPRTNTGKLQRFVLREQAASESPVPGGHEPEPPSLKLTPAG